MSQPQPQPLLVVQASQVYGLSIPNAEAASLTRKVIHVSLILMMLQIAYSFYNVFALDQSEFMTGTFLSLLVPLCGYCKFLVLNPISFFRQALRRRGQAIT